MQAIHYIYYVHKRTDKYTLYLNEYISKVLASLCTYVANLDIFKSILMDLFRVMHAQKGY